MATAAGERCVSVSSLYPGSDKYYNPYIGKGKVLFTGPDGISDQKVSIIDPTYIGIGTMSPEGTSDLNYLWRPGHKKCIFPPAKSRKVGEIGWGINLFTDIKRLKSGEQIMRGEFRQECEDRHTHLYQNPWYPHPKDREDKKKSEKEKEKLFISSEKGQRDMAKARFPVRHHSPGHFRSFTPAPRRTPPLYDGLTMGGTAENATRVPSPGHFRTYTPTQRQSYPMYEDPRETPTRDTSEGHYSRGYSSRSHTPMPVRSPGLYDSPGMARPPPRPVSCTPTTSSRARSGTMSSTTSRHSQVYS